MTAKKRGKSIQRGMSPGAELLDLALPDLALPEFFGVRTLLVDGTVGLRRDLLQRDLTEGLLVLGEVVAEDVPEGFGLLRAEVDAFEVFDDELFGAFLGHGAEDEEEVPDAHADLHAVGVVFAVAVGGDELE